MIRYIAYIKKDALRICFDKADFLVINRFECGWDIEPTPKDDEDFHEMKDEKAVIFPSSGAPALGLKCKKNDK